MTFANLFSLKIRETIISCAEIVVREFSQSRGQNHISIDRHKRDSRSYSFKSNWELSLLLLHQLMSSRRLSRGCLSAAACAALTGAAIPTTESEPGEFILVLLLVDKTTR